MSDVVYISHVLSLNSKMYEASTISSPFYREFTLLISENLRKLSLSMFIMVKSEYARCTFMISALLTALHLRITISCETLVNFLCFIQELLCFFPSLLPKDFACPSNVTLI